MLTKKNVLEFLRYALVGASGIIVNLFYLYTLTESLHLYYLISEIFAFSIATLSNFIFNKVWTFREMIKDRFFSKGFMFFVVAGVSLLVNLFFLWFFTEIWGIQYLLSQIFASGFTLITNFIGNKFWTFRKPKKY